MPPFNTIDIILTALLAVGLLRGILRGLSGELASLISLVVAGIVGWRLYPPLGMYLTESTRMTPLQADTVSFLVLLVGALILLWALRIVLKHLMEFTFKGLLERLGGGLIGLLRYAVLLSALILLVHLFGQGTVHRLVAEESFIGRHVGARLVPLYDNWAQDHPSWPRRDDGEQETPLEDELDLSDIEWPPLTF